MALQQEAMQLALDYGRRVDLTPEKLIEVAKSILEFLNTPVQYRGEYDYSNATGSETRINPQPIGYDFTAPPPPRPRR